MNVDAIRAFAFEPEVKAYTARDTILYALALGMGDPPTDPCQLKFTYEVGLSALPMMAVTLGVGTQWYKNSDFAIDWKRMLHGEESLELFAPLPIAGTVAGRRRVGEIVDRGEKGAVLYLHRDITDLDSGRLIACTTSTMMLRGDGGFGGEPQSLPRPHAVPDRVPDVVTAFRTTPQSALLYRLCGDMNPLHADPGVASTAGFTAPILHGLCTFGLAGRAVLQNACGNDPARLAQIGVRFTSPVYPGETLRTQLWIDGDIVSFRVIVADREIVAIDNGRAVLRT
jgi:acyl dehydratase